MAEETRAGAIPELECDALDAKALELLGGKVVRKDLTALMRRGANVPTFVLEYLLGMYCSTSDPDLVEQGVARIRRVLTENYVRPDARGQWGEMRSRQHVRLQLLSTRAACKVRFGNKR